MTITATEFKTNLGKYLDKVDCEDIYISKNGKIIAQLTKPNNNKISILRKLVGVAEKTDFNSLDDIRDERLKRQ
ncbi:MAG: type II toxin-antitoxin system prevent-host-death family antitoxin [Bacilli bacterium]|nr:type II toxin-antitoxin system prevent-host-death family antitoxin [Bacilli bacterium]